MGLKIIQESTPAPTVKARDAVMGIVYENLDDGGIYMLVYNRFLARLDGSRPGHGWLRVDQNESAGNIPLRPISPGTRLEVISTYSAS